VLEEIRALAQEAGEIILKRYGRASLAVTDKADGSPVTDADRASHDFLTAALPKLIAEPVLSEEGVDVAFEERRSWGSFWVIDPLDGTQDFILQTEDFCVNIARVVAGRPVLGIIYAPALGITWGAEQGAGAWRWDAGGRRRIETGLREGPLVGLESRTHPNPKVLDFFRTHGVTDIQKRGASTKYGLIAEGAADLYAAFGGPWVWDVASGDIILAEAGGFVSALDGSPLRYDQPSLQMPHFVARHPRVAL
jgi:3'(2'), 5'-bisphosphate nucleotidase